MRIECPHCHEKYEIEPSAVGQNIQCQSCGKAFEVTNPNLVPCPDCFGMISKRATKCPHCGAPIGIANYSNGVSSAKISKTKVNPENENEPEKVIMVCHPDTANYTLEIIGGAIACVVVIGIFILLALYIEMKFTTYKITNRRIIVTKGWITKSQKEIWIKDMRGATLDQNIWQRFVGVGNISIGTAATADTEICLVGIAHPQQIVDKINALRK